MKLKRRRKPLPKKATLTFSGTVVEKWSKIQIHRNYWRFHHTLSFDDLLQEAYLVFHRVKTKYDYVDEDKWLFSLYKRAFHNRLVDLANKDSKQVDHEMQVDDLVEYENSAGIIGDSAQVSDSEMYLIGVRLAGAPDEVKDVCNTLLFCPDEVYRTAVYAIQKGKPALFEHVTGLPLCLVREAKFYFQAT